MRAGVQPEQPGPGQESVWDYPRPPRLEATDAHIRVEHAGRVVVDSRNALRVLETSHPPSYYLPPQDVDMDLMVESPGRSTFCEWKGAATYYDLVLDGLVTPRVAWAYRSPSDSFAAIRDHLSFYPQLVDACWVDDDRVTPVEGSFYGGWVTSRVVGPFKGGPGTMGW